MALKAYFIDGSTLPDDASKRAEEFILNQSDTHEQYLHQKCTYLATFDENMDLNAMEALKGCIIRQAL